MALPDAHGTPNRETVETLIDTLPDLPNVSQGKGLKQILEFFGGFQDLEYENSAESKFVSDLKQKLFSIITLNAKILENHDPQLVADVLECMRTSMSHAAKKQKYQLSQLWSSILNADKKQNGKILVMLFEIVLGELQPEAVLSPKLYGCLQELLQSDSQEERKSAIIVLKKLLNIVNKNPKDPIAKQLKRDLKCELGEITSYINVLEALEADGSSDILTSLATNLPQIKDTINTNENWMPWIPIPYKRLLMETRNIVLIRWGLEYIMDNLTATELNDYNLLIEFLAKTNSLDLYNMEEYILPKKLLRKFVDRVDLEMFFGAFTKIVWQQVPLHNWLNAINDDSEPQMISIEILLKLSEQVRSMNNHKLQYQCYGKIFQIFKVTIDSLSSTQYMMFLDAVYDEDAYYFSRNFSIDKLRSCENMKEVVLLPIRPLYKIYCPDEYYNALDLNQELLKQLSSIPKDYHGWWRLPPLFAILIEQNYREREFLEILPNELDFYRNVYGVNIELVKKSKDLQEIQLHLFEKLECKKDDEKTFVVKWTTKMFISTHITWSWSQLEEFHLNSIEILKNCTYTTFYELSKLLGIYTNKVDINILRAFVDSWKKWYTYKGSFTWTLDILKYAFVNLPDCENVEIIGRMLEHRQVSPRRLKDVADDISGWSLPQSIIIRGLLYDEVKTGDDRIEAAYVDELSDLDYKYITRRDEYIRYTDLMPKEDVYKLIDELLRINESYIGTDISLEYSMDHRIQLRIGRTLLSSTTFCKGYWSDQLWSALVSPNNHLNVSFIYECLVALHMPSFQFILDKLQDFSSYETRPQHSILSVVHIHCIHFCENLKENELQEVLTFLQMQLTHENPQTVLLTQLILQKIVDECFECRVNIHIEDGVQNFIESSLSNTILDTDMETRVKLPIILTKNSPVDRILHRTKVPFDEYNKNYEMI